MLKSTNAIKCYENISINFIVFSQNDYAEIILHRLLNAILRNVKIVIKNALIEYI